MAFKRISKEEGPKAEYKSATALTVGEEIVGFLTGITSKKFTEKDGSVRDAFTLYIKQQDNKVVGLNATGNLTYLAKDGKLQEGMLTKIVRAPDKKVPGKKPASRFVVEQDAEQTIDLAALSRPASKNEQKRDSLAAKAKILEEES